MPKKYDEPISEGLIFGVDVEAENADKGKLAQVLKMAEERCPAIYSMTHIIGIDARIN